MASGVDVSAIGAIVDKVTFVNKIPLLMKATSDDETPTPGYMYGEINKLTLESGSHCLTLLDFLVDRLEKESWHVKLKVLGIMKHVVENGHPDFRHGLRQKPHGITRATKFHGPQDPLHGNAGYLMVRQAAADLCQVLFDVGDAESEIPVAVSPLKSTGGMGSSGQQATGTMQGFGSTEQKQQSLSESIVSGFRGFAERVADLQLSPTHQPTGPAPVSHYQPPTVPASGDSGDVPADVATWPVNGSQGALPQMQNKRQLPVHQPGRAGGGWDDSDEELALPPQTGSPQDSTTTTGDQSQHSSQSVKSQNSDIINNSITGDDWARECSLVEEFVSKPGLAKRCELDNFVKSCSTLSCEKVVEEVARQLEIARDDSLMRCLMIIERLLRSDVVPLDFMARCCSQPLAFVHGASNGPPKAKTRKLIRLLQKLCPVVDEIQEVSLNGAQTGTINSLGHVKNGASLPLVGKSEGLLDVDSHVSPEWPELRIPFSSDSLNTSFTSDGCTISSSDPLKSPSGVDHSSEGLTDMSFGFHGDLSLTTEGIQPTSLTESTSASMSSNGNS